jgi:hypothetical protein
MFKILKHFARHITTLGLTVFLSALPAQATECESSFVLATGANGEAMRPNEAATLGQILGLDQELVRFVDQPEVMTYIFLRFFDPKTTDRDLSDTLAKIAAQDGKMDLYDIFTKQIETKLREPTTAEKVRHHFQAEGYFERTYTRPGFWSRLAYQFKHLPQSIRRMKQIIAEDLSFTKMDRGTFDFMGALHFGWKESSLRAWSPVNIREINPSQIVGTDPTTWARISVFASEVEGGIEGYSAQSGEVFRSMFPNHALFTGKTVEEAMAAEAEMKTTGKPNNVFCTRVWCFEENRHTGALRTLYRQLIGNKPPPENPSSAYHSYSPLKVEDILFHLISRNATEWNAISSYTMMGAHATGPTADMLRNVREDEIKHMAVFGAGFTYTWGPNFVLRMKNMLKKVFIEFRYENGKSESGRATSSNPAILLEAAVAHVMVEKQVQRYLKSVPFKTLDKIVNVEPKAVAKPSNVSAVDPEKQAKIEEIFAREKVNLANLSRWRPKDRAQVLSLRSFEQNPSNASYVKEIIRVIFADFKGLEHFDSAASSEARLAISSLTKEGVSKALGSAPSAVYGDGLVFRESAPVNFDLVRRSLTETLRDYQVMNNDLVREKGGTVVLRDLSYGYEIVL